MNEWSPNEIQEIQRKIHDTVSQHPPTIGIVGVSGVGKSSTINAMFKTELAVSHTVACTKDFEAVSMNVMATDGEAKGVAIKLVVVDAPGLGEDIAADPGYIDMYKAHLPNADVILWVLSARNRAVALDQLYLQQLHEFRDRIVFGINQVDLVHPMKWNPRINLPSVEMEQNIAEIVEDRTTRLASVLKRQVEVIPYSAVYGYNLERLFATLINSCPPARQWIFASLKNFSYKDFVPASNGLRKLLRWR